ncbi:MAG: type II secretion system protein [Planctomycetota bacterium]|jgi:prepilin-type N-terminal cleavage/methylation domain-containing protein
MKRRKGLTLIELVIVILIAAILAAVTVPIMRGRIDAAKWSEAKVMAGTIKTAARALVTTQDPNYADYPAIEGSLGDGLVASSLGFTDTGLDGSYFNQADYTILDINGAVGTCIVTVISTHPKGPPGVGTLAADGSWSITTEGRSDSGGSDSGGSDRRGTAWCHSGRWGPPLGSV